VVDLEYFLIGTLFLFVTGCPKSD